MNLLQNHKKLEAKKIVAEQKAQKEMAEKLVKITDEVIKTLKEKDLTVFEIKTLHSLLGQRLTQAVNSYVDQKKAIDVI